MSDLILKADSLDRSFGGIHAVNDVSLEIPRGTLHAIIGPNGSGKTTLFNLITGHTSPSSGRVEFDGHDITGMAYAKVARRGLAKRLDTVVPALMRREGAYSSSLATWRRQYAAGELNGADSKKRGPKAAPAREELKQLALMTRERDKLRVQLSNAQLVIEVQKKVAELLEQLEPSPKFASP